MPSLAMDYKATLNLPDTQFPMKAETGRRQRGAFFDNAGDIVIRDADGKAQQQALAFSTRKAPRKRCQQS